MAKFDNKYCKLQYGWVNHEEVKIMQDYYEAKLSDKNNISVDDTEWNGLRLHYWSILDDHLNKLYPVL